jgi:hypothetical protein
VQTADWVGFGLRRRWCNLPKANGSVPRSSAAELCFKAGKPMLVDWYWPRAVVNQPVVTICLPKRILSTTVLYFPDYQSIEAISPHHRATSTMPPSNATQSAAMPMFPPPVNPSDLGRGPLVMGVTWTFSGLALIVVFVRFWVRVTVSKKLSVEDWLMLVAAVSTPELYVCGCLIYVVS